jgi:hypothetical protein
MLGICFFTQGGEYTGEPVWEGEKGGGPIFRSLGKLLRSEEVREDCGDSEVQQFAGSSQ